MSNYFQESIECASREEIERIQLERLQKQVKHVYANVPYYRNLMDQKNVKPEDIKTLKDLAKLPFLSKADLRDNYPDGLLAVPKSEVRRIQSTSGTTGKRVIAFYTAHDLDVWAECCARAIVAAGGTKDDVVHVSYGYGLFTGGMGLHDGSYKVGSMTLPMSSGNTERQIQFMRDLGSTILCCTPSYAAYIGETIKDMFGAEPWTENMRRDIEKSLGIKAYDIYGLTELCGPGVSFECSDQHGMHINEDHFIAEIIDPDTGEVLPYGEKGELVLTSIDKEAFPLIRYRTRDICILKPEKCPCGRTHVRMSKPMGRSDDMLIIRGVNVFPSQIETVLLQNGYAPNYLIEVDRVNNTDTLDINVELSNEQSKDALFNISNAEKELANAMKTMLGINPKVHLVQPKTITRSEGKAVRVIDKRHLLD